MGEPGENAASEPPRVGIVVRTKNRPWFLRRTFDDIAAQTFADLHVVVVNDGGDPDAVVAAIADAPPALSGRIDVEHNPVATGRSAAANQGVRALGTEFVVLHDDDDLWAPAFLAATVAHLDARADLIGVVARTEIVTEAPDDGGAGFVETGRAPFWAGMTDITLTDLLERNRAVPIAYLYRRALHDDVGYYREDIHAVEDWELHLRTIVRHRIGYLDPGVPLAFWMHREGVAGELGNSMYALADEHVRYDRLVRDDALRAYAETHGLGLPLYLSAYIRTEVERQLAEHPSLGDRVLRRARAVLRRKGSE